MAQSDRMRSRIPIAAAVALFLAACAHNSEPIGEAFMQEDGTIVLDLVATDSGAIGHARLRFPKDHPQYRSTLDHLGGLAVGERKLVPPWRDRP